MKVIFYSYPWGFQKIGGGEIQLLKTKEYLERQGIQIKLFNPWEDKLENYDILHLFGSVKDSLGFLKVAKEAGLKICLSPMFWTDIRRWRGEIGIRRKTEVFLRHVAKRFLPFLPSGRRKMYKLADLILPNSESEARQIKRYFLIQDEKFFIVPNGVELRFKDAESDEFVRKYNLKDFILYVGRVEPRKNQLNFIKAMKNFRRLPIVFVGDHTLEHKYYYQICLQEKTDNMHFLGYIDHDSSLFASMYAACRIFCLTSWFETPGLSALEAALAGKNLVLTPYGSTREYFGEYALYARPHCIKEIRTMVEKAIKKPFPQELKRRIVSNYSWENVALSTREAYQRLLNRK